MKICFLSSLLLALLCFSAGLISFSALASDSLEIEILYSEEKPEQKAEDHPKVSEEAVVTEPESDRALSASTEPESDRSPSAKKIKKANFKRDRSFNVPRSQIPKRKKKRLDLSKVKPSSSAQLYYSEGGDEAELEKVINEEINQLFQLLKKNRNAELTLRLGSLYVEKSRLISFKIQMDYERKMAEFKAGQRKTKPYLNLKPSQVYNRKSLQLFEDFKESYPKHKRMDEVLFFLGFNFYQLKKETQGIKYFSELEKSFPKSPYLYEARFQLGEHYFQLRKWKNSFDYYSKVAENKRGKFYFFALYKMAWSLYKLGQARRGLVLLERIIKEGRKFPVVSDRNQAFTFNNEAIQDLVLFYTYSKKSPTQAKAFFLNLLDEEVAWSSLKRLAYAYRDTSQAKGVYVLFTNLIEQDPAGEKAMDYKYEIVQTMYNLEKTSEIIRHINEWVSDYGPKSPWFQANKRNRALIEKSMKFQEVTVRNYALKNHETFRTTKSSRSKNLALNFYKIYFNHFRDSEFLDQMGFFYGELLFDSRRYISAAKSYEEVIAQFPNSKYVKAAFVNQVLALEKILPKENEIDKIVGPGEEPVEFPKEVEGFIKAADRYIQKFPKEENTASILYRVAALYYRFNQFDTASRLFKKLSDEYPTSKLAANVGVILLDVYNKNKDYKSLEELAVQLSQNKNVNKELLAEVNSVLEQISFKKAQDLALSKKYEESAKLYEKFARSNPSSALAPSAFYNAGLNFEKSGNRLSALSMYSAVLTYKSPKYKLIRKKSQEFSALLYEKLGFYKKAANAYVSFAKLYPSDPKSSDFWYNGGVIFDALNDISGAVYSYQKYFALSKKADRHEIFYFIGFMYERNRIWKKAVEYYSEYLKSASSNKLRLVKASSAVANIYEKRLRNKAQAQTWHQKTLGLYKRLRAGVSYGASSHFYLTKNIYDRFSRVKIPLNAKQQESAVAKKIELLKNLERALKPVIRYDDGEQIIASLSLIAKANHEMAKTIFKAPIPKGLDKKGILEYRKGIKKIIEPYVKKSVEHYKLAIKKSSRLELYSEWVQKSYKGLAEIKWSEGEFHSFSPDFVLQKTWPLEIEDTTGTVIEGAFKTLTQSLRYGVSQSDFKKLAQAISGRNENSVLTAVSAILNRDPDNLAAINSLALFYYKQRKWALSALILNRVAGVEEDSENPIIMNNLALISLKYGDHREAITYLKKALDENRSYAIARVNLANIFIQQYDYENAYKYYKKSYSTVLKKWPSRRDRRTTRLLNNYGVALTGVKEWDPALFIFKNLTTSPSPSNETLFNYAVFLAERSRTEGRSTAKNSLLSAQELIDELSLASGSSQLKAKVRLLSVSINEKLKELKGKSSSSQKKRKK